MIITSAEFVTSAATPSQYPPAEMPEIAFAGRSNVGKSSLINRLVNRKQLVKTSRTPGRTQLVNFFRINNAIHLVDLPGYGYARAPEAVRKKWGPMIETYLSERSTLKGVVLIIDIRRIPGHEEIDLLHWLVHHGLPSTLVLTKSDKLSKTKQRAQQVKIGDSLRAEPDRLLLFSAKSGKGKEFLWKAIGGLLEG